MDGADHGVVLFSMGLSVSKLELPIEVLQNFMSAFGRLRQRVLAVIGSRHRLGKDSVPENVLVVTRVSQKSVAFICTFMLSLEILLVRGCENVSGKLRQER